MPFSVRMVTKPFALSHRRMQFRPAQLTFKFKKFRLTGYISPPSSSACHWSKEFQVQEDFASLSGQYVGMDQFFGHTLKSLLGIGRRKVCRSANKLDARLFC